MISHAGLVATKDWIKYDYQEQDEVFRRWVARINQQLAKPACLRRVHTHRISGRHATHARKLVEQVTEKMLLEEALLEEGQEP